MIFLPNHTFFQWCSYLMYLCSWRIVPNCLNSLSCLTRIQTANHQPDLAYIWLVNKTLTPLFLYPQGSVLVFVDKQESADELMSELYKHSYPCMALHGGIDQHDRDSIISDFKKGDCRLMVTSWLPACLFAKFTY